MQTGGHQHDGTAFYRSKGSGLLDREIHNPRAFGGEGLVEMRGRYVLGEDAFDKAGNSRR